VEFLNASPDLAQREILCADTHTQTHESSKSNFDSRLTLKFGGAQMWVFSGGAQHSLANDVLAEPRPQKKITKQQN
jgi:hypothetical protein